MGDQFLGSNARRPGFPVRTTLLLQRFRPPLQLLPQFHLLLLVVTRRDLAPLELGQFDEVQHRVEEGARLVRCHSVGSMEAGHPAAQYRYRLRHFLPCLVGPLGALSIALEKVLKGVALLLAEILSFLEVRMNLRHPEVAVQLLDERGQANLKQLEQLLELVLPPLLAASSALERWPEYPLNQEGEHDADYGARDRGFHPQTVEAPAFAALEPHDVGAEFSRTLRPRRGQELSAAQNPGGRPGGGAGRVCGGKEYTSPAIAPAYEPKAGLWTRP
jgi:hypothetical protein